MRPIRSWTPEKKEFLKSNYGKLSYAEIAERTGISIERVKSQASNMKITNSRKWPESEIEILKSLYPNTKSEIIAKMIGRPLTSIYGMAQKLELKKTEAFLSSDLSGRLNSENAEQRGGGSRFRKGQTSWNKGKKIGSHPNSVATQFKKGLRPHNWVPVGTEVVATIGYKKIKIAEPNVWEWSHLKLWQEHNGDIPASHMVYFKDRNRMNVTIENLGILSRQEWMKIYSMHNYPEDVKAMIHMLAGFKRRLKKYAEKQD